MIRLFFWIPLLLLCSPARATVLEFGVNGITHQHEAVDYTIRQRTQATDSKGLYEAYAAAASMTQQVDEDLIRAIIHIESHYQPHAISPSGAQGLMQLMPSTAKRFAVDNAFNPSENIRAGVAYLSWLLRRFNGDEELATAAYNAGEGAVDKYHGVPPYPETLAYLKKVKSQLRRPFYKPTALQKAALPKGGVSQ